MFEAIVYYITLTLQTQLTPIQGPVVGKGWVEREGGKGGCGIPQLFLAGMTFFDNRNS